MESSGRLLLFFSWLPLLLLSTSTASAQNPTATAAVAEVSIGVILGVDTKTGRKSLTSMRMAVDDFYALHMNSASRIVLRVRDSKQDAVDAAAAAMELMEKTETAAIIGPATSDEAKFVVVLGNATQTPIISYSASSPSISVAATPYFVRATVRDSDQSLPIAAIVKFYSWRQVAIIYEDSVYGAGVLPYLIDALQSVDASVPSRAAIPLSASDDRIAAELYRLKTLSTRIFVVHMLPPLASRLFRIAAAAGMLAEGYAWIATDGITNVVDMPDGALDITAMQGVIGVRPRVPISSTLDRFTARWRARFRQENPDDNSSNLEPSVFQLWAYDATKALAAAVEKAFRAARSDFIRRNDRRGSNDSIINMASNLGIFDAGPQLLSALHDTRFRGLSGEFRLAGGELDTQPFEIINIVGKGGRTVGFWTPATGIFGELGSADVKLKAVIWPGESTTVPRGWEIPTGGKKLRIAVPVKNGFRQFVDVQRETATNATAITGYCIDVFDAVMASMPYSVRYEYVPFKDSAASYDDLVSQVFYKNFDAVVGDTTILANRSEYVDFTLPYTESGVAMVVPLLQDNRRDSWIFLKPLTTDLWLGGLAFFFLTGLVVWAIEHDINPEFKGRPSHQMGTTLYFVFSTLTFSHKEKLKSNLSRAAVVIWLFVVLILTSSYTASLTSMLTVRQLEPKVDSIGRLLHSSGRVGYQDGSFVYGMLRQLGFEAERLQNYSTPEQYKNAMLNGSGGGGVDAVFDEIPYLKVFLSAYCTQFAMVGRTYKTDGFGFVLPRDSPLLPDVSRAILNVTERDIMINIESKWFGDRRACPAGSDDAVSSSSLDFWSFGGLFLVTGIVTTLSMVLCIGIFFCEEWNELKEAAISAVDSGGSIWKKMVAWARHYDSFDDDGSAANDQSRNRKVGCKDDAANTGVGLQLSGALSISDGYGSPEVADSVRTSTTERMPND